MKTGLGIRSELFEPIINQKPALGFLEAHSENYFLPSAERSKLLVLREDYPISLHGVGLSLGRADDLDHNHLIQLKTLSDEIDPLFVSEHLAWSAYSHQHLPDLLPLPLTDEAFDIICAHINQMQDTLQRQILLENPSNYLLFDQIQQSEPNFLNAVAKKTGCALLIDVNNIYVSSQNLQRSPTEYLEKIDRQHVAQYHLAGHIDRTIEDHTVLIDTHNQLVCNQVWQLYENALKSIGHRPTIIEWDSDFPKFTTLLAECKRADSKAELATVSKKIVTAPTTQPTLSNISAQERVTLKETQATFLTEVLNRRSTAYTVVKEHQQRLWIYQNNSHGAVLEYLQEVYPATQGVVGQAFFKQMANTLIQEHPPRTGNIYVYGEHLTEIIKLFPALKKLPYLTDLMGFEWAQHCAYFAHVAPPIDVNDYEHETLLTIPVAFNRGVWFASYKYPVYEIHRQSLPSYIGAVQINLNQSQDKLLVYKQNETVTVRVLSDDEFQFLNTLAVSDNLLQALDQLSGSIPQASLSQALALTLNSNLLHVYDQLNIRENNPHVYIN